MSFRLDGFDYVSDNFACDISSQRLKYALNIWCLFMLG